MTPKFRSSLSGSALRASALLAGLLCAGVAARLAAAEDPDLISVDAFQLPRYSSYLSKETRTGLERGEEIFKKGKQLCDPSTKTTGKEIRACEALMYPPIVAEIRKTYDVEIVAKVINGVQTDIITPAEGVPEKNKHRVLINLHGGAFKYGARFQGQLEAMPLAAIGKYKVIAVDYRMAPEHQFPAASIDVAAVFRELLKDYEPSNIGIYGCSAGGRITGQTVAWMSQEKMPLPGAIAILCSPPTGFGGDSNIIAAALQGTPPLVRNFREGYFKDVRPGDPVAFPGDSDEMLIKFPPSLLMTSTRDYSLSPMVQMHARLVRLGIKTELHIYEGLAHGVFFYGAIPEARQAATTMTRFFDEHLSSKPARGKSAAATPKMTIRANLQP